jgi:hypothetical protein
MMSKRGAPKMTQYLELSRHRTNSVMKANGGSQIRLAKKQEITAN